MKRSIKTIFMVFCCVLTAIDSFSQYYTRLNGDSTGFEKDSVVLFIDNPDGNVEWEVSQDTIVWRTLNNNNDSLPIRIDSSAYYRAVLSGQTCPGKSDIAFVSFKSINARVNIVHIDPAGGVYVLPSGIKLIVPPGAVNETVTLSLDLLDNQNSDLKIPFIADSGKVFCSAVYCEPAETSFLKPVRINIPSPDFHYTDLPYVFLYDSNSGLWKKHTGDLICSENNHFVEFSTDRLVSSRIYLLEDLFLIGKSAKITKGAKEDVPLKDCREGFIKVESSASDYLGQQGGNECFVSTDNTRVTFLSCSGKPVQQARIEEIGERCTVSVEDNINKIKCLKNGEEATITITVTIGGKPLKEQKVIILLPSGLSTNSLYIQTNDAGQAIFTVKCEVDKFEGTITYKVYYEYFLQVVQANAGGLSETSQKYKRTGTITIEQFIGACPESVVSSISLYQPSDPYLTKNDQIQLNATCIDQTGNPMACSDLTYTISSSYPAGAVTIDNNGLLTAMAPGCVIIYASSASGARSNEVGFSVGFEGDLSLDKITDHNINQGCGCQQDYVATGKWKWYVVTYTGRFHFRFWLNIDLNAPSISSFKGDNTIGYNIDEPSLCKDTTMYQHLESNGRFLTQGGTTQNIIAGETFSIVFEHTVFAVNGTNYSPIGFDKIIFDLCQMTSTGIIQFSNVKYFPEGCVAPIYEGSCILQ